MADINEVVVTSTGQEGWCGGCGTLKITVSNLAKEIDALEIRVGLMEARAIISTVIADVYDRIEFEHDGRFVCDYGDVHSLRRQYRRSPEVLSALNKALYAKSRRVFKSLVASK